MLLQTWMLYFSPWVSKGRMVVCPIPLVMPPWPAMRAMAPGLAGPAYQPGGTGSRQLITRPSFIPLWHSHECRVLPGPSVS